MTALPAAEAYRRWADSGQGFSFGGAPGFVMENVYVLPGLPSEMEAMFRVVEHEHGYRAQYAYPQRLRLICQFCFWMWGATGRSPSVVGWFTRDELIPLCWAHLEVGARYGMQPRRLLGAPEVEQAEVGRGPRLQTPPGQSQQVGGIAGHRRQQRRPGNLARLKRRHVGHHPFRRDAVECAL